MTEQRRLKRGQMFLNLWSGWENIFVVLGTDKAFCYGVEIAKVKGDYRVGKVKYYLKDLRNDCEHFPLIGEIDVKAMWLDRVFERITSDGRKILDEKYDYNGHRLVVSEVES